MRHYLYAALLVAGSAANAQSLCDTIHALTLDPTVAAAHWGVSVTTLDGTQVCGVNEAQLFRPASNNKIFTSAAAMALLGPERRFTTSVVAVGKLSGSELTGDLVLMGGGDANLGGHDIPYVAPALRPKNPAPEPATIADIDGLATQIAASGLKTVKGDIVGDDSRFAWEPYPPDWTIDDAVYGYGAPVSGLTIHDNEVEVDVYPGSDPGGKALLKTVPAVPYYALEDLVLTRDMGHDCDAHLGFRRAPGAKLLTVYGDIPPNPAAGAQPCRQNVAMQDPAEYAAQALKLALERRGVRVTGTFRARHVEANHTGSTLHTDPALHQALTAPLVAPLSEDGRAMCYETRTVEPLGEPQVPRKVLATHQSPTLLEDVMYTMKVSQNLHAELLLRNLGAAYSCELPSQSVGLQVVREYILRAGVQPADFVLYDGSGLSAHDLVTPRAFTTFLRFASTQPWFEAWRTTLPEGGTDGTLTNRFGRTLGERVHAKTGTLSQTRALSGYVTTNGGQTVIFSILVDTHLPTTGDDRGIMDRIVQAIAGQN